jgi:type III pantothenate kinase
MIVDIDVGNTRLKWRVWDGGSVVARGGDSNFSANTQAEINGIGCPQRIRLACVGGETVVSEVALAARRWGCEIQRAQTTSVEGGVVCGYDNPEQMGVDRWLAILAAWQAFGRDCVVVDAGSAVTVDLLDSRARHLGGYIVPGLKLMRESLRVGTARVKVEGEGSREVVPGCTTVQAVMNGCQLMVAGLVDRAVAQLSGNIGEVKIVVTGGDGELLLPLLSGDVEYVAELVMDGLEVMFP